MFPRLTACLVAITLSAIPTGLLADEVPSPTRRGLYVMNADGTDVRRLLLEPAPGINNCGSPSWSRDGSRVAFDATADADWSASHIHVLHLTGPTPGLVEDLGPGVCPEWSPDGTQIAWNLHPGMIPGEPGGIYVMNSDGTGRRKVSGGIRPRWSPNGEFLLCTMAWSAPMKLNIVDLQTLEHWPVEVDGCEFLSRPDFSADASTVVVAARRVKRPCILLLDISTQPPTLKREVPTQGKPITHVVLSPNGEFAIGDRWREPGDLRLLKVNLDLDQPDIRELEPDLPPCRSCEVSWSPDGKRIVFASNRSTACPAYFEQLAPEDVPLPRQSVD